MKINNNINYLNQDIKLIDNLNEEVSLQQLYSKNIPYFSVINNISKYQNYKKNISIILASLHFSIFLLSLQCKYYSSTINIIHISIFYGTVIVSILFFALFPYNCKLIILLADILYIGGCLTIIQSYSKINYIIFLCCTGIANGLLLVAIPIYIILLINNKSQIAWISYISSISMIGINYLNDLLREFTFEIKIYKLLKLQRIREFSMLGLFISFINGLLFLFASNCPLHINKTLIRSSFQLTQLDKSNLYDLIFMHMGYILGDLSIICFSYQKNIICKISNIDKIYQLKLSLCLCIFSIIISFWNNSKLILYLIYILATMGNLLFYIWITRLPCPDPEDIYNPCNFILFLTVGGMVSTSFKFFNSTFSLKIIFFIAIIQGLIISSCFGLFFFLSHNKYLIFDSCLIAIVIIVFKIFVVLRFIKKFDNIIFSKY